MVSKEDKVIGRLPLALKEKKGLFTCNLLKVKFEDVNSLLPKILLKDKYFNELCESRLEALIIKLLEKIVGYPTKTAKQK